MSQEPVRPPAWISWLLVLRAAAFAACPAHTRNEQPDGERSPKPRGHPTRTTHTSVCQQLRHIALLLSFAQSSLAVDNARARTHAHCLSSTPSPPCLSYLSRSRLQGVISSAGRRGGSASACIPVFGDPAVLSGPLPCPCAIATSSLSCLPPSACLSIHGDLGSPTTSPLSAVPFEGDRFLRLRRFLPPAPVRPSPLCPSLRSTQPPLQGMKSPSEADSSFLHRDSSRSATSFASCSFRCPGQSGAAVFAASRRHLVTGGRAFVLASRAWCAISSAACTQSSVVHGRSEFPFVFIHTGAPMSTTVPYRRQGLLRGERPQCYGIRPPRGSQTASGDP